MSINKSGHDFVWQPDTGASQDIWSYGHMKRYESETGVNVKLCPSKAQLYAYGAKRPLKLRGQFTAKLRAGGKVVNTQVVVTDEDSKYPLMSEETARALGVVTYDDRFMVQSLKEAEYKVRRESEKKAMANATGMSALRLRRLSQSSPKYSQEKSAVH